MKLKKWIVYSLLLSFFVLLTPRTIWHDCDQDSHSHISKNDHLEHDFKFKGKCYACDFSIDFMEIHDFQIYHFKSQPIALNQVHFESFKHAVLFRSFSHRGPPIV